MQYTGWWDTGFALYLNGAAASYGAYKEAGERQVGSWAGADHVAVAGEWKAATLVVGGIGDVIAWPGPAIVRAVRVRKTTNAGVATANTAGIILIKNGAAVLEGAAAAATPGTILYDGLDGVLFPNNLTLNFASASDTLKIECLFRPLDPLVTWAT
jgi:hypothetical protein